MTRVIFLSLFTVMVATHGALAGDYHTGGTLNCAECHVMHYSQQHGYNADGSGTWAALGAAGPYDYLLRDEVNLLCLTCHDGQVFAPDVLADNGGVLPTNGRQAGALNRDNLNPYFDADGHTLGSTSTAPGGTWNNADGLDCVDCHTQHGEAAGFNPYRNLKTTVGGVPTAGVTYAIGTNDLTRDVFEGSDAFGGDHYDIQNVFFNEPDANGSAYAAWCQGCHTDFHGAAGDANMGGAGGTQWVRHPTADANIGGVGDAAHSSLAQFSAHPYRVQVMSPTGDWGTWGAAWVGAPADLTPSCMSCHKAHGNQNAFGLIFATGAASWDENGDGTSYTDLCAQCHVQ